jgi:NAD+ diphosphatase
MERMNLMGLQLPFNTALIAEQFIPLAAEACHDERPGFWAVVHGMSLLVCDKGGEQELPFGNFPEGIVGENEPLIIGLWRGKPLRVVRIAPAAAIPDGYRSFPFQGADLQLDNMLATIAGRAAQILHWERRSCFCSHCGKALKRITGGWGKRCPSCGDEHFPHIHPCIIVLVRRGTELLLIRNAVWSPGRFSLIAGFLDFGESLEECVRREVREEAGIEIRNIRYVGSQCWPFPSQVMVGFVAEYDSGEVQPDGVEVVEAGWFSDENPPLSPSKRSIARWIIETCGMKLPV